MTMQSVYDFCCVAEFYGQLSGLMNFFIIILYNNNDIIIMICIAMVTNSIIIPTHPYTHTHTHAHTIVVILNI